MRLSAKKENKNIKCIIITAVHQPTLNEQNKQRAEKQAMPENQRAVWH